VMVIEVGLGGRLDATNVLSHPLVTAITSIGMDHCHILGNSLEAIAREKAGILKPGCPLIVATLPHPAQREIFHIAQTQGCPVRVVPPAQVDSKGFQRLGLTYQPALGGQIQAQNSSVALGIVQELNGQGWKIPPKAQQQGLAQAQWPGRYQTIQYQEKSLLIDGAHNPEGAKALRQYLGVAPVSWIIGIIHKKDSIAILEQLVRPGDEFLAVPVPSGPGYSTEQLVAQARQLEPLLGHTQACSQVREALALATQRPVLCGSLYLIGDFLAELGYTPESLLAPKGKIKF